MGIEMHTTSYQPVGRQQALMHVANRSAQLRHEEVVIREQARQLVRLRAFRPLTTDERDQVHRLRADAERVQRQLQESRREFDALTGVLPARVDVAA
jgi:hypothetical protein